MPWLGIHTSTQGDCVHVSSCRLRFDFSNNGPVDAAQLAKVESICREWVSAGKAVSSKEVSLAQAKAIKGLRAVFGEVRGRSRECSTYQRR